MLGFRKRLKKLPSYVDFFIDGFKQGERIGRQEGFKDARKNIQISYEDYVAALNEREKEKKTEVA